LKKFPFLLHNIFPMWGIHSSTFDHFVYVLFVWINSLFHSVYESCFMLLVLASMWVHPGCMCGLLCLLTWLVWD
jgi:hypothetical protein